MKQVKVIGIGVTTLVNVDQHGGVSDDEHAHDAAAADYSDTSSR